jgi:hypothetical protein
MAVLLTIAFSVAFLVAVLVVPFKFVKQTRRIVSALEKWLLTGKGYVVFQREPGSGFLSLTWIRAWSVVTTLCFAILGLLHGGLVRNDSRALITTVAVALLAVVMSTVVVALCFSLAVLVNRSRGYAFIARCGLQGVWNVEPKKPPLALREAILEQVQKTCSLRVLDVTGHGLLGRGSGPAGGLLYDALKVTSGIPVRLLLLHPEASDRDPDYQRLSVVQSVLSDMGVSLQTYARRLQATLDVVEDLNEDRPDEAKIEVRFCGERPIFRAVIADCGAFVSPWDPKEENEFFALFTPGDTAAGPSFFNAFRSSFARLWSSSLAVPPATIRRVQQGSRALRRSKAV